MKIRLLLLILGVTTLSACGLKWSDFFPTDLFSSSPGPTPTPTPYAIATPTPSPSFVPPPAIGAIAGRWTLEAGASPSPGACPDAEHSWILTDDNGTIRGTRAWGGIPTDAPPAPSQTYASEDESVSGTYVNGRLDLIGTLQTVYEGGSFVASLPPPASPEAVQYQMNIDPVTGALTGTRNGDPYWATPVASATANCLASP